MALRSAGKSLSSLSGVVVLAAALWLLLNFVYAPSCGRFACGYEPAWLPQAEADSGSCPDDVKGAATDDAWAADRLATIADEPTTKGLFYDEDGTEHSFTSSPRDEHADRVNELLRELRYLPPGATTSIADHVEAKVAASMRDNTVMSGVLIINHPAGPCPPEATSTQPLSCRSLVPILLPKGASLTVWWQAPGLPIKSMRFVGDAT
jgi:hypothetical protein